MPATARKPRFLFRELPGLLPKSRRHQRDQRAALSSKPVLVFWEQTGKWGVGKGPVFPLRHCTSGVLGLQ